MILLVFAMTGVTDTPSMNILMEDPSTATVDPSTIWHPTLLSGGTCS